MTNKVLKVLIACEESQRVCIEFRKLEHEVYSCDIEPCSGGHPEWHIQNDVLPLLNGNCEFHTVDGAVHRIDGKWDMIIAHPPCTYLSNAGARHLWKNHILNQERYEKGLTAKEFFMKIFNADCEHIVIENPVPSKIYELPPYTQIIQPFEYGHPYSKKTCLWLKNIPMLQPTDIVPKEERQSTKIAGNWFNTGGKDRQKNRAKTFEGIAKAMAEQWANTFKTKGMNIMTKKSYSNATNKLMRKVLKYEDNLHNYTLDELSLVCTQLAIVAREINKEYPEDTFYKEMCKCIDRILENKRNGVNWND